MNPCIKQFQDEKAKMDDFYVKQLKEIILGTYKSSQETTKEPIMIELKNLSISKRKIQWATPLVTEFYYEK